MMRGALTFWGVTVFVLVLLFGSPAAFWLGWLPWAQGWAPQGVSGTLWQGQAQRLGHLSTLRWSLAPSTNGIKAELRGVALEYQWHLQLKGWPWAWTARLGTPKQRPQGASVVHVAGAWQGHLLLRGAGTSCLSSEGSLTAPRLDLLSPWGMPLGAARVSLDCRASVTLQATLVQPGGHRLGFDGYLLGRHGVLSGDFETQSEIAALVRQFGLMTATQRQFSTALDW